MLIPPSLKPGDKIGLIAPSRMITEDQISKALLIFNDCGLEVVKGENLLNQSGYFAGTDEERLNDLQSFIDESEIKAIFCARGGYGMTRIIDKVNITSLTKYPKWIIGFSDITALHLKLSLSNIASIHGLMPAQYGKEGVEKSLKSLKDLLFNGKGLISAKPSEFNKEGSTQAELIGGNLSLIAESLGTETEVDTDCKILFLEEIDEYLYKIDRMLNQLKRAGKFDNLVGLIIGDFSDMKDTQIPFGKDVYDLIDYHVRGFNYPAGYNFPIGHERLNMAVPLGIKASLKVKASESELTVRINENN